jgi:hypothetical protein
LAVTGKRDKTHDEVAFIRAKGAELMAECIRAEDERAVSAEPMPG